MSRSWPSVGATMRLAMLALFLAALWAVGRRWETVCRGDLATLEAWLRAQQARADHASKLEETRATVTENVRLNRELLVLRHATVEAMTREQED